MYLTETQIRGLIKSVLSEGRSVVLPSGKTVEYGSKKHIEYLEDLYQRLCHERSSYKRGTSTRADYSAACRRTKRQIQRARKYADKMVE